MSHNTTTFHRTGQRIVPTEVIPRLRTRSEQRVAIAIFTLSTAAVAIVGAIVTNRGMEWYDRLDQASFNPPDAVFGPVWSALYAINALAGYLVWRSTRRAAPTVVWGIALALNQSWTLVFFGAHRPVLGLVVIVLLWLAIVAFAVVAAERDSTAALLMIPYLSWVAFAGVLNIAIARAN